MKLQLEVAVAESEAALLQLTRDRLLRQMDAMAGAGGNGTAELPSTAPNTAAAAWQAGQRCVFRSTDGRHYLGIIERVEGGTAHLRFATPTRCAGLNWAAITYACNKSLPPYFFFSGESHILPAACFSGSCL